MGNQRLGIDPTLALHLKSALDIETFVETGTYKGGTALWAAQHFRHVYTIEGFRPRFDAVTRAHAGQHPNLTFIFGDSRHYLARVLGDIEERTMLWLDAHWCGEGAHDSNGDECPLVEELMAVNNHPLMSQHVILIDDARLFLKPPGYPHDPAQWPTYAEVETLLLAAPRYVKVIDDVIVAVPANSRKLLP